MTGYVPFDTSMVRLRWMTPFQFVLSELLSPTTWAKPVPWANQVEKEEKWVKRYLRLVTSDGKLVPSDSGWEQTDKFEWEKTVGREDVEFLDDEDGSVS